MAHATGKPKEHIEVPIFADTSHLSPNGKKALEKLMLAVSIVNPTKGNNYYSKGMTREDIESYLDEHPDERDEILSPFTVVEQNADGSLRAIPYSEYYRHYFVNISALLSDAAEFIGDGTFKTFLESRARAFLSNRYRESDIDWVRVSNSPIELTIGPYESYEDKLFGVKRDIEAVLGIVLPEETKEAQLFQEWVAKFDAHLGKRYGYTANTALTPMIVMDEVLAAGHPLFGYVPMAYNLPNDADIQREVGSKKVFIQNVMRAKMERITVPIAELVLNLSVAKLLSSSIAMDFVIGRELSRGLDFRFSWDDFLELGSPLEEGKADVFGMLFLYFLAEKGIIEKDIAERAVILNLTDGLRQIRFGIEEAHAIGKLIQYNYFLKKGAMRFTGNGIEFNPSSFKQTLIDIGDDFYGLSQTRNHQTAQHFVNKWGGVPNEVRRIIESFTGIPVDIDPVFKF